MNEEQITREIREAKFNSWELTQLADDVRTQATRKLTLESIEKKKDEIEKLEQRVKDIDNETYQESMYEDNDNHYENR